MTKHRLYYFVVDIHDDDLDGIKYIMTDSIEEARTASIYKSYIEHSNEKWGNEYGVSQIKEVTIDFLISGLVGTAYTADNGEVNLEGYGVASLIDIGRAK